MLEIEFEPADQVDDAEVGELVAEMAGSGATAEVLGRHQGDGFLPVAALVALVGVSTTTVAGLAVVVVFMYRAFRSGVIIDLTRRPPRIRKNGSLPRGSLLVIHSDGREEYREGIADAAVAAALRDMLSGSDAGRALS